MKAHESNRTPPRGQSPMNPATASPVRDKNRGGGKSICMDRIIWVRTDLVEAVLANGGTLPAGWRPKKLRRYSPDSNQGHSFKSVASLGTAEKWESWGWCRARVCLSEKVRPGGNGLKTPERSGRPSHFGQVQLKKTGIDVSSLAIAPSGQTSPWRSSKPKTAVTRTAPPVSLTVQIEDDEFAPRDWQGRTITFQYTEGDSSRACMANAWWQTVQQPTGTNTCHQFKEEETPSDLTCLEQLHEPAVVYCLQRRYRQDEIYTYTGKILLALNPFRALNDVYGENIMERYWNNDHTAIEEIARSGKNCRRDSTASEVVRTIPQRPPPHIYAIAEDAYQNMMISFEQQQQSSQHQYHNCSTLLQNQSILVSGESGAGKTMTTKFIMRYLAVLSQRSNGINNKVQRAGLDRMAKEARQRMKGGSDFVANNQTTTTKSTSNEVSIESRVLQSNPILESFGNARTIRNDNSSRFGKFIEISFERTGCLVSASVQTYLLEKVRLISQEPGERNYHVFYELLAGLSQMERKELRIHNHAVSDFQMTAMSGTFDRRDGISDTTTYKDLRSALSTVGFTQEEQMDLFATATALLHTSNLTIQSSVNTHTDASELDQSNSSLKHACHLLGVDAVRLNDAVCKCAIETQSETLYKVLSKQQAEKALEALIKTTYAALFQHIVAKVNSFISVKQEMVASVKREAVAPAYRKSDVTVQLASIGVLDIFGFESFQNNSFEQLCINYCNEALQQQFNRFVFKLEQEEYAREGIDWSFIEFPDNQDVLDLIEKKKLPTGILPILDEQCRLPRCTDATFAQQIYNKCFDSARFAATKSQQVELTFSIQHYAGWVEYQTANFLEKNKNEVPKECTELLQSSGRPFLQTLGCILAEDSSPRQLVSPSFRQKQSFLSSGNNTPQRRSSSLLRQSVGSQFSSQLASLRERIEGTAPHYVRCLKPNDDLVPYNYDSVCIADQLCAAGVLEAIRVSRVGFPNRYFHDHFVQRYEILARRQLFCKFGKRLRAEQRNGGKSYCEAVIEVLTPQLLEALDKEEKQPQVNTARTRSKEGTLFLGMQMGRTKVFLRRRAFEALEHLRSQLFDKAAMKIQSYVRMHLAMATKVTALYAIVVIQSFARRVAASRIMREYRLECSVHIVQRAWRCHLARKKVSSIVREKRIARSIHILQQAWRCYAARKKLYAGRYIAWWCQGTFRGAMARRFCAYLFLDRNAGRIQRAWKHYTGKRMFRKVRRSVVAVQNRHRGKVAYRQLLQLRKESRDLSAVAAERDQYRDESRKLRKELELAKNQTPPQKSRPEETKEKTEEMERLQRDLQQLQMELEKAHRLVHSPRNNFSGEIQSLTNEVAQKEEQIKLLRDEIVALRSRSPNIISSSTKSDESMGLPGLVITYDSTVTYDSSETVSKDLQSLHSSIRNGNRGLFNTILRHTSDPYVLINEGDKYGRMALHIAVLMGNLEMIDFLVGEGAVVNAQDEDGETPLHLAESVDTTKLLLKGRANPNIPNVDGICALHLAVQRRDIDSVRTLLLNGANVDNADNIRWFTPLHLIALPARNHKGHEEKDYKDDIRCQIAHLLCGSNNKNSGPVDMDYQDSEGNAPLHYACQMDTADACGLVQVFLENDANPNVRNDRNQTPLHLLCHNEELQKLQSDDDLHARAFQETLHCMLVNGADPNAQSLTGCSPVHLALYHQDIDSAVQLIQHGGGLHMLWSMPKQWPIHWENKRTGEVLGSDMVQDESDLFRIFAAITYPQAQAPACSWCMHCQSELGTSVHGVHCRHCSRLVCDKCRSCLPPHYFLKSFGVNEPSWACVVCEKVLTYMRKEISSTSENAHPFSLCGDNGDGKSRCSC